MTKFLNILLLFTCGLINAHKNVIFEKSYGNVNLTSSTSFYTEEVNKNIITAKYVELLLKELNYNETVNLRLSQESEFKCYAYFGKEEFENKGLNILIFEKETDVIKTLNLIENIILNQKKLENAKDKFLIWYNSNTSKLVEKIHKNKMNRPKDVSEIKSSDFFDYFYENGVYHILSYQNREVIEVAQVTNILQFSVPTPSLLFMFTEMDSLKIISANYKYNFDEKMYHPTSETVDLKFVPEWEYSFRPYSIRLLGQKYITIESLFGEKVSLYNISKKSLIQDLSTIIEK
jgi:hypothetical protein